MVTRRRWLQFSLRGFLAVMTVGCLWLGWKVEQARKRGEAVAAILAAGGTVVYERGLDDFEVMRGNTFWSDIFCEPVRLALVPLDDETALHLSHVYGVTRLHCMVQKESDLKHLELTRDIPQIDIICPPTVGNMALGRLQDTLPNTRIYSLREPPEVETGRFFGRFNYRRKSVSQWPRP